jgi:hypothetical protein
MKMTVTMRQMVVALVAVATMGVAVYAAEYNFYEQADKKGCASIITERGQAACAALQDNKDRACSVAVECDVGKHERLIAKYKEAKDQLDRGQVADADKDRLKQSINAMKQELDANKAAARAGTSVAQACVDARSAVQKWFAADGVRLTERVRDAALSERKELLDRLADAQKKQSDAKAKRDAHPSDSDSKSAYERATENMRNAEKALEQFNNKYGRDIERYASKLVSHYAEQKDAHDKPLKEASNRVANCKKLDDLSY